MKNKRIIFISMLALIALVAIIFVLNQFGREINLTFTQSDVNEKLVKRFPISGNKLLVKYTLSNPTTELKEGGIANLALGFKMESFGREATGHLVIHTKILYRASTHAFYLKEPAIDDFVILSTTEKPTDRAMIKGIAKRLSDKITGDENLLIKAFEENKEAIKEGMINRAEEILAKTPIYTIKSDNIKLAAAKIMLKNIAVDDGTVTVTLDVLQGIIFVILYICIGLAGVAFVYGIISSLK